MILVNFFPPFKLGIKTSFVFFVVVKYVCLPILTFH